LGIATARGYLDVLLPLDTKLKQDTSQNTQAYLESKFALKSFFQIVYEATSTDFSTGDARTAWEGLKQRFEPNNGAMKVQVKADFDQKKID
jgi:hypothetical protein